MVVGLLFAADCFFLGRLILNPGHNLLHTVIQLGGILGRKGLTGAVHDQKHGNQRPHSTNGSGYRHNRSKTNDKKYHAPNH